MFSKGVSQPAADSTEQAIKPGGKTAVHVPKVEACHGGQGVSKAKQNQQKGRPAHRRRWSQSQRTKLWGSVSADPGLCDKFEKDEDSALIPFSVSVGLEKDKVAAIIEAVGNEKRKEIEEDRSGEDQGVVKSQQVDHGYDYEAELAEVDARDGHPFWDTVSADPMKQG